MTSSTDLLFATSCSFFRMNSSLLLHSMETVKLKDVCECIDNYSRCICIYVPVRRLRDAFTIWACLSRLLFGLCLNRFTTYCALTLIQISTFYRPSLSVFACLSCVMKTVRRILQLSLFGFLKTFKKGLL